MTQWNGFDLSLSDKLRSQWNATLVWLRNRVRFRRGNYVEKTLSKEEQEEWTTSLNEEERGRLRKYETLLGETAEALSLASQRRTWATLDLLHAIPHEIWTKWKARLPTREPLLLDAGCQDFSRAPAIQAFFRALRLTPHLTGVEFDAYGLLGSMHSRADRGDFFSRIAGNAKFQTQDFFLMHSPLPYHAIFCFYPFVSPHPALAWGLPYEFGDAGKWIKALERTLIAQGMAVVVHQGAWEEEEFQGALAAEKSRLKLVFSAEFQEIFELHPHASRIGVYSSEA